jgi:cytochrome b involved in lipid metabolism
MKYVTFVLLAILMINIATPTAQVLARSNNDESQQEDSRGGYDDNDDSNESKEGDNNDDSVAKQSTSTNSVVSTNADSRIKLLQELLMRLIALLNELKGGSSAVTPVTPVASSTALSYTAAVVATHNTTASCWSIINSNVYDLTSYISRHPGGSQNIIGICGKDGTSAFMGQHGGSSGPANILSGFYLAPLAR